MMHIEVKLTYPDKNTDPKLIAYVGLRFTDNACAISVRSCRLLVDDFGNPYVSMPHEARRARCFNCSKTNVEHAKFCNWCGAEFYEPPAKSWLMDVVVPCDNNSRAIITNAVLAEYHKHREAACKND